MKKMNKIALLLMLLLMLLPNMIYASPLDDKVTVLVPKSWNLLDSKTSDTQVSHLYHLKTDIIGSKTHYSNALVRYYTVPASVTIAQADGIIASHTKGATLILTAQDDPHWKTYLLINYEKKEQYIVLYRIGIVDGVCLEVMLCFPHIRDKEKLKNPFYILTLNETYVQEEKMMGVLCNPSDIQEMVDTFNNLCKNLRIFDSGEFKADVRIVELPRTDVKILRHKEDSDAER